MILSVVRERVKVCVIHLLSGRLTARWIAGIAEPTAVVTRSSRAKSSCRDDDSNNAANCELITAVERRLWADRREVMAAASRRWQMARRRPCLRSIPQPIGHTLLLAVADAAPVAVAVRERRRWAGGRGGGGLAVSDGAAAAALTATPPPIGQMCLLMTAVVRLRCRRRCAKGRRWRAVVAAVGRRWQMVRRRPCCCQCRSRSVQ